MSIDDIGFGHGSLHAKDQEIREVVDVVIDEELLSLRNLRCSVSQLKSFEMLAQVAGLYCSDLGTCD